jgi:glucose/arabinose dehydrogenase
MSLRQKISIFLVFTFLIACGRATISNGLPENQTPTIAEENPTQAPPPTETEAPELTAIPQASFPDPGGFAWNLIADGFQRPLFVTHSGDGSGRLFIVEQDGAIRVFTDGAILPDPFLDINDQVGSESNEQGMLGLAFHPDYEQNGFFYINYTDVQGDTVIARFNVSADPNVADPASEKILLQVDQPFPNHNGGHLEFGPDGYLYFGLGDGGSQGDPNGNGQSLETYLAKLLRVDVNSGDPYAIPADNPFANGGGLPEIWAYGLRNPWRFSFDIATGNLFIADVGQGQWEEVNFLPAGSPGGSNFGWNFLEGTHPYKGDAPEGLIAPVTEYEHGNRCSVTGGYAYRGQALPAWQGVYIYADYCSGEVFGLVHHADGSWESQLLYDTGFLITSFGLDEAGEIYVLDRSGGLYQLQTQ